MGLNFDQADNGFDPDAMKKRIEEAEINEARAKSEEQARAMKESVRATNDRIKANLTKELTQSDRGWIDKYMHSDLFKEKDKR